MNDEVVIIKSNPSVRAIGFCIVGTIFFGAIAYMLLSADWKISAENYWLHTIIMWTLCGGFLLFALACLWTGMQLRTIVLTNKRLIIKNILPFFTKNILISNIKDISESPLEMNASSSRVGTFKVYDGKQVEIKLQNGKSFKISSFEISDYYSLIKQLRIVSKDKNALLRKKQKTASEDENPIRNNYQGYGWLLFVIILTCGLVYALIKQKFFG